MTFTYNRPTKPGWYWMKKYGVKRIIRIWTNTFKNKLYTNEDGGASLDDKELYDNVLWGTEPIEEPKD